ncbi:hypothetical protein KYK30_20475 [Shinella yambaruensis]|uniref:DNA binding HTH domain-containing protein n=1 Tax=Shinella yambaruensis TaxID=415996 RepID=A0ABQ5ZEM7_9HYPH|nr:hypothetical protein [Shinella yambaruensis]MCJ8027030.1 hypothetical protein [Shinella yambaruensis]MCU7982079.1 hypothetical protein [Shinella yambaruensis]GLR51253.1 hypothetical protein GCM10007923_24610 [Shinella yambaruensis]
MSRSSLPGLLGDIADIAGSDVALTIARSHGGTRVSIPPRAEPNHWLTRLVGLDVADRICRGLAIVDADGRPAAIRHEVLPLGPASARSLARRRAAEALAQGASGRAAAREAGLHERTIWRMKAKDKDQGELF